MSLKMLTKLLNYLMILLMLFTLGVFAGLPWLVTWYLNLDVGDMAADRQFYYYYTMILLYGCGLCALVVLNELRKIFKTCVLEDPFVMGNVRSLNWIGRMCFLIAAAFFTKIFVLNSFFTILVVFVFVMAMLFCFVLAQVFARAVAYKTENDLTI